MFGWHPWGRWGALRRWSRGWRGASACWAWSTRTPATRRSWATGAPACPRRRRRPRRPPRTPRAARSPRGTGILQGKRTLQRLLQNSWGEGGRKKKRGCHQHHYATGATALVGVGEMEALQSSSAPNGYPCYWKRIQGGKRLRLLVPQSKIDKNVGSINTLVVPT